MTDCLLLSPEHPLWERVADYAQSCSWDAGKALARDMRNRVFSGWEAVVAALDGDRICGYCSVSKKDCMPELPYTPYVGFVFVDEAYRGRRLSRRMLDFAADYLKSVGFHEVYLASDHVNLYEKYGFAAVDRKRAFWGGMETIYRKELVRLDGLPLRALQPSQFYVSEAKLAEIARWFDPDDLSNFEPIPVRLLDGILMMTDGHTRAVAAIRAGLTAVPLQWEPDEWDWEMYRRCVRECRERGVVSPHDLTDRVVSAADYRTLWMDWCDDMHAQVGAEREKQGNH